METNYQRAFTANGIKRILAGLGLAAGVMLTQPVMAAGPAPVDLASCSNFTIVAGTAISSTGGGIINGDIGLYPGTSQGIPPAQVHGTIHVGDAAAQLAKTDLTAAYNDAALRSVDRITLTEGENIGGQTLAPGLYWSASSLEITGDLTLAGGADDVWIFQMGSTLTTAAGGSGDPHSRVILAGGAQAQNIFWQVGSSATIGSYAIFAGTIMAQASVTMDTGSFMVGRALARTGAVTFDGSGGSIPTTDPGWVEIQMTPASGTWQLTAPAGYTGPTTGTGDLAAVSAVVGAYQITYGALSGYMAPTNQNQSQFVVAGVTSLFVGVYRQISTNIAPPIVTATLGTYTNKVRISWQSVPGVTGYEIWKSRSNDVNTALIIAEVADDGSGAFQFDDNFVVPVVSYYYWGLSKTATQVSPMGLVSLGYASLPPDPNAPRADLIASDMVYLPVNVTNLTTAGTVSFRLGNIGPTALNTNAVAFDFRMGSNDTAMVWLGSAQRAFTNLVAGQEQLVILTAQEKRNLVVPATLSGIKQVQVTVRHTTTALFDPNLTNNTTTAAGLVLVRAAGVNSPARSVNDYDGDGKSDVAVYSNARYKWYVALSGVGYGSWLDVSTGSADFAPVPGDYDGDGITDLAVYNSLNGWWLIVVSSTEQLVSGQFGGPGYTAAQCDFDGDALSDPVIYRVSDGTWYGAASSSGYTPYVMSLGGIGYQLVTADYDGDGLADPAAYNLQLGLWSIRLSSDGYQSATGLFGGFGNLPASADYDGDGLADPAIYAPSTSCWQLLLSSTLATHGYYTWLAVVAGTIGGVPVPADYDGDGIADLAVYHQDTGLWELYLSAYDHQEVSGYFGGQLCPPVTE